MKKFWSRLFIISLLLVASLISTDYVSAQLSTDVLEDTGLGQSLGGEDFDLVKFISQVVQFILGFLAIVFTILIIWAGAQWMTAGGEEKKVETAKQTIKNSIIGLIIILCSYAITLFVFNFVNQSLLGSKGEAGTTNINTPTGQ